MTGTKDIVSREYQTDREIRWCPGCGDYAVLAAVQRLLSQSDVPREKTVFVSGIGCSSRLPHYLNTYGFQTLHGRAPAFATGIKLANPDLDVWVVTGDADGLSIGGNHFLHVLRRNVGLKMLFINNRVMGLTHGQPSNSLSATSVALSAEATFVARTIDVETRHLEYVLKRASEHRGSAFVEIAQNCNVFNDHAFENLTAKDVRCDRQLILEHNKPMLFGVGRQRGIRLRGLEPECVVLGRGDVTEKEIWIHDERQESGTLAYLLSRFEPPDLPVPLGVLRQVSRPTYEDSLQRARSREESFMASIRSGPTWTVPERKSGV